jgi:hypothetical protein
MRRAVVALALAFTGSLALALSAARERAAQARAQLNSAALRLDDLAHLGPADDAGRTAIAWGYAERLRLGLESPFRLIEAASRDPRLTPDERQTVSWALLAHVARGESHRVDPATLDGIGPADVPDGDRHLHLIEQAIRRSGNPRAAELAIRLAYELASVERVVDASAPQLVASVSALVADGEIARREATDVIRHASADPIGEVRARRARRSFYLERPTLLMADARVEKEALGLVASILDSVRDSARARVPTASSPDSSPAAPAPDAAVATRLYRVGALTPPEAALGVTIRRLLPILRGHGRHLDVRRIERARNAEMLIGAIAPADTGRAVRTAAGRLLVSTAVAMRSLAQQAVWFPGDSAPSASQLAASLGVREIVFDRDVPAVWRPYFLRQLADGMADLQRVFPALGLESLRIRFRLTSPADSALAMHDPRTRTLHLPVYTAGGTLTHELAHDLDRHVAEQQGHVGYRTDYVARNAARPKARASAADNRVASALRALTEEFTDSPRPTARLERPAEIFATRVDWFVAQALASRGRSSGFLTAVQDEVLTGHVVHPERLRSSGRARSLIVALQGMTPVAGFAAREDGPGLQALLRWALTAPVDRDVAASILRGRDAAWEPAPLIPGPRCERGDDRAMLVWLAADARARGWVRQRARWLAETRRPPWARAALGQGPWNGEALESRVAALREYLLTELSSTAPLSAGMTAYAAPLAREARCG